MKIRRITFQQTFGENRVFNGTDISAEFLNQKGQVSQVSFHYAYATKNYQGLIEKVLDATLTGKVLPEQFTNVLISSH
jgi:hypothetical protein